MSSMMTFLMEVGAIVITVIVGTISYLYIFTKHIDNLPLKIRKN